MVWNSHLEMNVHICVLFIWHVLNTEFWMVVFPSTIALQNTEIFILCMNSKPYFILQICTFPLHYRCTLPKTKVLMYKLQVLKNCQGLLFPCKTFNCQRSCREIKVSSSSVMKSVNNPPLGIIPVRMSRVNCSVYRFNQLCLH